MNRLSLHTLRTVPAGVGRPTYDAARLGCGIVNLGSGAFHRAHQAVFTEDAVQAAGGDWGIVGISLRRPGVADALTPQDGLYTLELRQREPSYRVVGVLRRSIAARQEPDDALKAVASPDTHVVTLTVTEPGYAYGPNGGLDLGDPDVAHDLAGDATPRSTVGWLVAGLARRRAQGAGPVTVISCDNLRANGAKLGVAVLLLASRRDEALARWIETAASFPDTVVDAITPASDAALATRVATAIGLEDRACVQREPFAQWVIADRFAGPRPAWDRVGVEIVADVSVHQALKLHVLNAAHSALAYLGLARGHALVRQATADHRLSTFLDGLVEQEVGPALTAQGIAPRERTAAYWRGVRRRFAEPGVDHRLSQIACDGAAKLRERVHPLLLENARAGRPTDRLAAVIAAWLAYEGRNPSDALDDPSLFDSDMRGDPVVRGSILAATSKAVT